MVQTIHYLFGEVRQKDRIKKREHMPILEAITSVKWIRQRRSSLLQFEHIQRNTQPYRCMVCIQCCLLFRLFIYVVARTISLHYHSLIIYLSCFSDRFVSLKQQLHITAWSYEFSTMATRNYFERMMPRRGLRGFYWSPSSSSDRGAFSLPSRRFVRESF